MKMKNIKHFNFINLSLILVLTVLVSCERGFSDEVEFATLSNTAEIFTDAPVGMGTNFYFPFGGSKATAWSVDEEVSYRGTASMRFDIPNFGDPGGAFAGAIFRVDGVGRDLTGFDALTFWAKGSEARAINEVGFGQDFLENKYQTQIQGALQLTTNWVKYVIPIPDPSKLFDERGMFWYAEGPNEDGTGWTFWIDDLKFEKLGTLGPPRPAIENGEDITIQTFIGTTDTPINRSVTFNVGPGGNQTVVPALSYFDYASSEPSVVSVGDAGSLEILSSGSAVITATMSGIEAEGTLTYEVLGEFEPAPTPPVRDPDDVISVFSDAYSNVAVDYYNGFFAPFQTTLGGADIFVNDDFVISYTNLNFVAIGTFRDVPPVNANDMTHFHVDINVREAIQDGDFITLQLLNNVGGLETSGEITIDGSQLASQEWVSLDIPLEDFAGLTVRNQLGLIFFISDGTISNIYVDNVYYYRE